MITLVPGPSQLSPQTEADIRNAIDEGIMSVSHRSGEFTKISKRCVTELRKYLSIPDDYRIFYFDSASSLWNSMIQNVVEKNSFHFVNGAFSGKAWEAAKLLNKNALADEVTWGTQHDFEKVEIQKETELITACYNETATGVKMLPEEVHVLRERNPDTILAVDIVSCAGAVPLTITDADVWYFSVQKCFGLPAGLGIGIIGPRAFERSQELTKRGTNLAGMWAWERLEETMINDKYQTPQTPNVLGIYLLGAQCERWNAAGGVEPVIEETLRKKKMLETWVHSQSALSMFVEDEVHRSNTVCVVSAPPKLIIQMRDTCKDAGIILGAGYGKIKSDTIRIANFPAVTEEMLEKTFATLEPILKD